MTLDTIYGCRGAVLIVDNELLAAKIAALSDKDIRIVTTEESINDAAERISKSLNISAESARAIIIDSLSSEAVLTPDELRAAIPMPVYDLKLEGSVSDAYQHFKPLRYDQIHKEHPRSARRGRR